MAPRSSLVDDFIPRTLLHKARTQTSKAKHRPHFQMLMTEPHEVLVSTASESPSKRKNVRFDATKPQTFSTRSGHHEMIRTAKDLLWFTRNELNEIRCRDWKQTEGLRTGRCKNAQDEKGNAVRGLESMCDEKRRLQRARAIYTARLAVQREQERQILLKKKNRDPDLLANVYKRASTDSTAAALALAVQDRMDALSHNGRLNTQTLPAFPGPTSSIRRSSSLSSFAGGLKTPCNSEDFKLPVPSTPLLDRSQSLDMSPRQPARRTSATIEPILT